MVTMSEFEQNIKESILIILGTAKGERIMRPYFGCGIHNFVFEATNTSILGRIETSVREALTDWEPRIILQEVEVLDENEHGKIIINIGYIVRTTNNKFNLVYPFLLKEGA